MQRSTDCACRQIKDHVRRRPRVTQRLETGVVDCRAIEHHGTIVRIEVVVNSSMKDSTLDLDEIALPRNLIAAIEC